MRDVRRRDLLLVALTFAAGAVDAVMVLRFDVFTAIMTGNLVFLGIAVGQGAARTALRSLVAVGAYALGVIAGARIVGSLSRDVVWTRSVTIALAVEWLLQAAFFAGWLLSGGRPDGLAAATLIVFSAVAMGLQAATARAVVPGASTTYVTGTITGLLSELSALGTAPEFARRASSVAALALGAVSGAFLLLTAPALAPVVPLVAIGAVLVAARPLH